ncbi:phage/plasmid primase, P4 family [Mycoplasmatota bacterium WC44]
MAKKEYPNWVHMNKDDQVKGVIENKLASELVKKYGLAYDTEVDDIFQYDKTHYNQLNDQQVKQLVYDEMEKYNLQGFYGTYLLKEILDLTKVAAPNLDPNLKKNTPYFNLKNGVLDIVNMKLLKHSKKYQFKYVINVDYNSSATCPNFEQALYEIFEGDLSRNQLIQEIGGYILMPIVVRLEKGFIFYGTGSNGKSIILNLLEQLLPKGCGLVTNFRLLDLSIDTNVAELRNSIVNIAPEDEITKKVDTSKYKSLISGESQTCNRKYKNPITFTPNVKMIMGMNKKPMSSDKTNGFTRRNIIIPFNRTFTENEKNIHLLEQLKSELSGIMNFYIEGARRLINNNYKFTKSAIVEEFQDEFLSEFNPVRKFIKESFLIDSFGRIKQSDVYKMYSNFIIDENISINPTRQQFYNSFFEELKLLNVKVENPKIQGYAYVKGISIKSSYDTTNNQISNLTTYIGMNGFNPIWPWYFINMDTNLKKHLADKELSVQLLQREKIYKKDTLVIEMTVSNAEGVILPTDKFIFKINHVFEQNEFNNFLKATISKVKSVEEWIKGNTEIKFNIVLELSVNNNLFVSKFKPYHAKHITELPKLNPSENDNLPWRN